MKKSNARPAAGIRPALFLMMALAAPASVLGQTASSDPTDAGKKVYQRGNCVGCHKWHGDGGGGYGGDARSLRKTPLTRDQIITIVNCGRPGTGMPYFARGAFDTFDCYGGVKRADLGQGMPPEAGVYLRPTEVEQVTDYVLAHIKGKGEPNYEECVEFFGSSSRACSVFKADAPAAAPRQDQAGSTR